MTAELKEDGTLELTIRREFSFPRELVFEAWLNKDHLAKWMGPTPDINLVHTEVNAKQGGTYRLGFQEKGCSDSTSYVHGEYLEIIKPEKLVFTWIWKEPLPEAGIETLVTVEFSETKIGTEILLAHQRFMDEASRERHDQGWCGTFDKLGSRLPQFSS